MTITRVRTLATFSRPDIKDLVWSACAAVRYPGTDAGSIYKELSLRIAENELGLFVGIEDAPLALCVAILPTSCLMMAPQIPLLYNRGSRALIRALAVRVREWIVEHGHTHAIGANMYQPQEGTRIGNRPDAAFCRGFRHFGDPEHAGSLIRFRF